eukprot:7163951-Heterocapsa_arctica.AAC.1
MPSTSIGNDGIGGAKVTWLVSPGSKARQRITRGGVANHKSSQGRRPRPVPRMGTSETLRRDGGEVSPEE